MVFLHCCFWCFQIFQVSKKLLAYQKNASIIRFLYQAGSSGSKYHNGKVVGCFFEDELAAQIVLRKNNQENEFSKTICVANSSLDVAQMKYDYIPYHLKLLYTKK